MSAVAIIPARGGSKRIPRKNLLPFDGVPMIARSIRTALASGLFERVVVSTDDREIADLPLTLPAAQAEAESAWHLYVVRLQLGRIKLSHRQVFEGLRAAGIGVNLHYIPVHLQPYYRDLGFAEGDFPEAERYYAEAISLPLFPLLTDEQQDFVVEQLRRLVLEE